MSYLQLLRREAPGLLPLFGPILISQYAQIANGVVNTAMAARLGTVELGAVAVGVALWMPAYMFAIGILFGVLIFVSHKNGAGDWEGVRKTTHQGVWLGLTLGICVSCLLYVLSTFVERFGAEGALVEPTRQYLHTVILGMPFGGMAVALRFYCEGQNVVFPVTIMAVIMVAINAFLNYCLMFGNFGLPALGIRGCGLATSGSMLAFFLMLCGYVGFSARFRAGGFFRKFNPPSLRTLKELLVMGLPIGCSIAFEFLVFTVITLFVSSTGVVAVAAHQVAYSCMMLFFATPAALSMAAAIRVGNLRSGTDDATLRAAVTGIVLMSLVIGGAFTCLMLALPEPLVRLFTTDATVLLLAVSVVRIGAFFQLTDAVQVCLQGILRGTGDTTVPFLITTACYWLCCIPLGYFLSGMPLPFGLGISSDALGIRGWWVALTVSLLLASLFLAARVRRTFWTAKGLGHMDV